MRLQEEEKPITVHLMGVQTKNLKDQHAHRRKWQLIMLKDGIETVTPGSKRNTRQKTAGRVTANVDYKDLLRIPPIKLNPDGSLTARSCEEVRKEMKARKQEKGEDGKDKKKWFRAIRTEEPMKKKRKIDKETYVEARDKCEVETNPTRRKIRALESTRSWPIIPDEIIGRIKPSKEWDNL
jgi:hypothetical protein